MMENCEKTIILENLFLEKDKKKEKKKVYLGQGSNLQSLHYQATI